MVTEKELMLTMRERGESIPNVNTEEFDEWCESRGIQPEAVKKFSTNVLPSFYRMLMQLQLEDPSENRIHLDRAISAVVMGSFLLAWEVATNGPVEVEEEDVFAPES